MGSSIVLKGANFFVDSTTKLSFKDTIETQTNAMELVHGYSAGTFANIMQIYANDNRSTILIPENSILVRSNWTNELKGRYDGIFIPQGTKTITIKTTYPGIRIGLTINHLNGQNVFDSGWQQGNTQFTCDVSQYTQNSHMFAGSTLDNALTEVTLEDLGFSFTATN